MKRLVTKGKTERRSWDHVVNRVVQDNREFLTKLGS
jgi:hypothetical protein